MFLIYVLDNKPKHNLNLGNSVPVLNTYDVFATHNEVDGEEEDNEIEFLNKAAGFKEVEDSPVKNVTRFKRKWIVALIAVAFKILLVLSKKIDILDIESLGINKIFMPFLLYELTAILILKSSDTEKMSFMSTLLFLSNLPQRHTSMISNFINIFATIMQDMFLYLFIFIILEISVFMCLGI